MTLEECKTIRAKLRQNGGPLASAAADCIDFLLKETPAKPKAGIHPSHEAIVLLFQKRLNKPQRDSKEIRAFKAIEHLIDQDDLTALRRFFRQPDPKGYQRLLSARKKTPVTLMRDWIAQCDLAKEWCRLNPPAPEPGTTKFPEPDGWESQAPGNLGKKSWSLVCQQYPEIAEQLHNDLSPPA